MVRVRGTGMREDSEGWRPGVIVVCLSLKEPYRAVLRGEGVPSTPGTALGAMSLPIQRHMTEKSIEKEKGALPDLNRSSM